MNEDEFLRVKELLEFLRPSFPVVNVRRRRYDHMLALLGDVALQAAINYDHIVQPRIRTILRQYPWCSQTADVERLLSFVDIEDVLQWRSGAKTRLFEDILDVFILNGIADISALAIWIPSVEARSALLKIKGVGTKTYDYMRLLCGEAVFPLDRHFSRFLDIAGVSAQARGDETTQHLFLESCRRLGIDPINTERGLWLLMRSCA